MLLGCIGDDFTGSSDLGNTLVKAGMRVVQYSGTPAGPAAPDVEAGIVALKTRTMPVAEAVRLTVAELGDTPLIGFAGAPFTLAAYLIEGGPSKEHLRARAMMHADPEAWNALAGWLSRISRRFLEIQRDAGASVVQLFDSWAGSLSTADYRAHIAPHSKAALEGIGLPSIHFGVGTGPFLADMRLDGVADAVGVDWRMPLDEAIRIVGPDTAVQGNIDPAMLQAPWPVLEAHVRDVIARGRGAKGHILNLGHGVPPETDPDQLTRIVQLAHGEL